MVEGSRSAPGTSSYAILGLLAVRPWTAYELAQQVQRSLRWAWPRSERHAYDEPKRLVRLGWATARERRSGGRTRTEYRITAAGRRALQAWLATPPALPALEVEALLRVLFADQAGAAELQQAIRAAREGIEHEHVPVLVSQVRGYLGDGGPFPERLHLIALFADFHARFVELFDAWSAEVLEELARWPSTAGTGLTPRGRRLLSDILARFEARTG